MKCPVCSETVRPGEERCPSCGLLLSRREPEKAVRSFTQLQQLSKRDFWKNFAQERLYKEVEKSFFAPLILAGGILAAGLWGHRMVSPLLFLALAAAVAIFGLGMWFWMSRTCAACAAACAAAYLTICHILGGGVTLKEWTVLLLGFYPLFTMCELHSAYIRFRRDIRQRQSE